MNELDLLQEGLGNGTYYVVAENTDGRKSVNSNEVEVSDIMPSVKITKLAILQNGDLRVQVTATDIAVGTPIYAFIGQLPYSDNKDEWPSQAVTYKETFEPSNGYPMVLVTSGTTSYTLTIGNDTYTNNAPTYTGIGDLTIAVLAAAKEPIAADFVYQSDAQNFIDDFDELKASFEMYTGVYDKVKNTVQFSKHGVTVYSQMDDTPTDLLSINIGSKDVTPHELTPENVNGSFETSNGLASGQVTLYGKVASGSAGMGVWAIYYNTVLVFNKFLLYMAIFQGVKLNLTSYGAQISESLLIDTTLDAPTLTYAASDRKLEWEDVEGATSYAVYKDGKKVGTVEKNKFTPDPAAAAATLKAEAKTARLATLQPRAVYDLDKKVVGYVTSEGKFVKSLDKN